MLGKMQGCIPLLELLTGFSQRRSTSFNHPQVSHRGDPPPFSRSQASHTEFLTGFSQVSHRLLTDFSQVPHRSVAGFSQVSHRSLTGFSQDSHPRKPLGKFLGLPGNSRRPRSRLFRAPSKCRYVLSRFLRPRGNSRACSCKKPVRIP